MELIYNSKKTLIEINNIINKKIKSSYIINNISSNGLLIEGDNFYGMLSLLNNYRNKLDLVYIDPPFNTQGKFFYNSKRVSTISRSNNSVIAYEDNMPFEEYLEFIRERLVLIHKLLSDIGTLYFHIDIKVGHYIKILLDEIFGKENFINEITRIKSNPKNFNRRAYGNEKDVIFVYSKKEKCNIFNNIKQPLEKNEITHRFPKKDKDGRYYTTIPCHAPGETINGVTGMEWNGILPPEGRHWRCSPEELMQLDRRGLIEWSKNNVPRIKKYADEHQGKKIQDVWLNYKDPQAPIYPTEKNSDLLSLIIQQSSNEGSIIMDCFCGSGSFLKEGKIHNRTVIGIDKSEIALSITKSRNELKNIDSINI